MNYSLQVSKMSTYSLQKKVYPTYIVAREIACISSYTAYLCKVLMNSKRKKKQKKTALIDEFQLLTTKCNCPMFLFIY